MIIAFIMVRINRNVPIFFSDLPETFQEGTQTSPKAGTRTAAKSTTAIAISTIGTTIGAFVGNFKARDPVKWGYEWPGDHFGYVRQ